MLSNALLNQLASATSTNTQDICRPFIRPGCITCPNETPIPFDRGLLDTGAQGSNFISRRLYLRLPSQATVSTRPIDRIVRLGDARHLAIRKEVCLSVVFFDSTGTAHVHPLWYSVLDDLSHDLIIGLIDLIGPYYDLFADAVLLSRQHSTRCTDVPQLDAITSAVQSLATQRTPKETLRIARSLYCHIGNYNHRKTAICASALTNVIHSASQDGSVAEILSHPRYGAVFADNRMETRHAILSTLIAAPTPGTILPPWSMPLDDIAPEEYFTPDPTSFPDDILTYLSTSPEEARATYITDLETHVTPAIREACPAIMDLLTSSLALDVFVPTTWTGINMPPYHLEIKPGLPDHIKPRSRPVREALFKDAKAEFDRMRTYFYVPSNSPIASPLVVAPKATAPFIRHCGDYRQINPYIHIPQEPIPHVQQSIAKAAGWKVFVDLDMTNSFHQIPIDNPSSELLSVATPWGLYRPLFLPEGVGPASGILQSVVRSVFADYESWIIVIFDNFLILASDYSDATSKLELVLLRCKQHRLVLKMKKSWIGTDIVTFFGYEVRPGSWSLSRSRKDAIAAMVFPTNQKQMQSFLGAANFFHTHIPNYASWASSLYECTAANFTWEESTWTKDYRALFDLFKTAIESAVTLHFPDYSLPWTIRCDSSDHAAGAVLFQQHSSTPTTVVDQPIAFASIKYSGAAINWDTFKKEAFALYFGVTKFGYYLRGKEFILETDHRNLLWIESSLVPIIVRWRVLLQSYTFQVRHIPGKENKVADWLSRMYPLPNAPSDLSAVNVLPSLHDMFKEVHGGRSLHHGAKRTYLALCARYPGHGVPLRVIQDLVSECPICQKDRLPLTPLPHAATRQTLTQHTRTIGMDHVTVTPHDEDGYVGLLLLVELDTKFPQAYPVKDYAASTVATVLFRHYCTFGAYTSVLSDPGSAFMSDVVNDLNRWLGVKPLISLIGRHESNGTEHVNALFVGHLRRLVHDERLTHRWASDTVLPLINHSLATAKNDELGGISPSELKFGSQALQFFQLPPPLVPGNDYGALVTHLNANLAAVRSATAAFQASLRTNRHNTTPTQNKFSPGDLILWNPKENVNSFRSSKLAPKLLGPYKVLSQHKNDIKCVHPVLHTQHTLHSSRVTPFFGTADNAHKIALLDSDEYVVEDILQHKGEWNKIKDMTFLVRWSGYDSSHDSWEPWTALRRVDKVHAYLRRHGQASRIPRTLT
jgi:RNase H-like domain found in reverse transcriptase/Chromo (CHRromatin Organisation MOdifier) domain